MLVSRGHFADQVAFLFADIPIGHLLVEQSSAAFPEFRIQNEDRQLMVRTALDTAFSPRLLLHGSDAAIAYHDCVRELHESEETAVEILVEERNILVLIPVLFKDITGNEVETDRDRSALL